MLKDTNIEDIYGRIMVGLAIVGVLVNIGSLILLIQKRKKFMFHTLLKIMSVYDLVVISGCVMLYALPGMWSWFGTRVYPFALPFLLPIVQIAMMTSIYCTILMSFERYVRICHLCQLKNSKILTEENFWCYVAGFIFIPVIFYLPKFFEVQTISKVQVQNYTIDCTAMREAITQNATLEPPTSLNASNLARVLEGLPSESGSPNEANMSDEIPKTSTQNQSSDSHTPKIASSSSESYPLFCHRFTFSKQDTYIRVISRKRKSLEIMPSKLRQNPLYHHIYCIGLNTVFASLIPLLSLIYLNICTVIALRKMGREVVDWTFEGQRTPVRTFPEQSSTRQANSEGCVPGSRQPSNNQTSQRLGPLRRIMRPQGFQKSRSLEALQGHRRPFLSQPDEADINFTSNSSSDNCILVINSNNSQTSQQASGIQPPPRPLRRAFKRTASYLTRSGTTITKSVPNQRSFLASLEAKGIDDKLNYIVDLGVDSVFLSAFYEFGGVDMGYDVVNHMTVDPTFGSDRDLEALLISLQEKGLKLIVDFVPNHTSNKHEWFNKTVHWNDEGNDMYKDYYIWRNASNWQDNPSEGNRQPPNSWTCSVPGLPAWTFDETRNQYYLHTLLPEMPDLNLANENVRSEIKDIFKFWLSKSPIFGVRIGAFNLLFEDESDQTTEVIKSDVEATLEFLDELRDIAEDLADADGTKRLFLVEMVQTENLMKWQETYRNATLERGNVIPFNLGILPWKDPTLSGDDVHQSVQDYIAAIPQEEVEKRANALLCWEMDNHDKFAVANDSSRMPYNLNEVGMMITMLLPGTMMIYYGDEIGMSDSDMIKCADTVDPYALPPYASECKDFPSRSRDPGRAPMQWNNETHSGFTNGDPWLPLSSSYLEVNVEVEQGKEDSKLNFFKKLLQLRQEDPIYHGEVFYPYHDKNIFSFLRMDEDSKIGLLVVVNIHEVNDIELNIHSVMPGVPNEGMIRLVTSNGESEANYEIGSTIELNEIMLNGYEGLVIEVDFNPSEEGEH